MLKLHLQLAGTVLGRRLVQAATACMCRPTHLGCWAFSACCTMPGHHWASCVVASSVWTCML